MSRRRLAVTGATGLIGRSICSTLTTDFDLELIDRRRTQGDIRKANMRNSVSARRALRGADTVIALAADLSDRWRSVRSNNLPSTWNTFDAARRGGARRVVYFSSNHVTGLYERDRPYSDIVSGRYDGLDPGAIDRLSSSSPVRPDGPYGVGKVFDEGAGRYFSESFGLSVICLRIGTVKDVDRPTVPRDFATLLTKRDLCHLVRCCIEAPPTVTFGIFYGVSANTWRFWSLDESLDTIGYRPRDNAETWRH